MEYITTRINMTTLTSVVKKNLKQKTQYIVVKLWLDDLTITDVFHKNENVFDSGSLADLYCDNAQNREKSKNVLYKVIKIIVDKKE